MNRTASTWRDVLLAGALTLMPMGAQAQLMAGFASPVYAVNQPGNIVITGNALLTCSTLLPPNAADCAAALGRLPNTGGTNLDNNNHSMIYVNADAAAGLANSSMARLSLPAGAEVTFAKLYWHARAASGAPGRDELRFKPAGATAYTAVRGTLTQMPLPSFVMTDTPAYLASADVTALVKAAGAGDYHAGGIVAIEGTDGHGFFGGWALAVAYQLASEPLRHLAIYDGAAFMDATQPSTKSVSINIGGLLTPGTGTFKAYAGAIVAESDRGGGDTLSVNTVALRTSGSPTAKPLVANFANSTISDLGVIAAGGSPADNNTMGVDYSWVQLPTPGYPLWTSPPPYAMDHGAMAATVKYAIVDDTLYLQMLAFATDLYLPDLASTFKKTAVDANGDALEAGDVLEYTVVFTNTGQGGAKNVRLSDVLPANMVYAPGSLHIVQNAGGTTGPQSDASGDDLAEVAGPGIAFRLGAGASALAGGTVASGASVMLKFRVRVDDGVRSGEAIVNTARVDYQSITTNQDMAQAAATVSNIVFNVMAIPMLREWAMLLLILALMALGGRGLAGRH